MTQTDCKSGDGRKRSIGERLQMSDQSLTARLRLDVLLRKLPKLGLYIANLSALSLGLVAQFFAFVVLARHLGSSELGKLVTIIAATTLAAQLCGFGVIEIMIRRVSREPALYPIVLGHSLILMLSTGTVLTLTVAIALTFFVQAAQSPIENFAILLIFAFSNILLYPWILLAECTCFAHRKVMRTNILDASFNIWRSLVTIVACVGFGVNRIDTWAAWYGLIYVIGAIGGLVAIWQFGPPQWRVLREEVKLGIHNSTSLFFDALRQNVDVLVLSALVNSATVGIYGAAWRIVLTGQVTVNSFTALVYPKLAVAGKDGIAATIRLAIKYVWLAAALAAATSCSLFVVASYLPWFFGKDFGDMVLYLQILCWILVITAIRNAAYDALGAADMHVVRSKVYNVGTLTSAALIAGLTWIYGLPGTFIAQFVSQGLLALALWMTALTLSRRSRKILAK